MGVIWVKQVKNIGKINNWNTTASVNKFSLEVRWLRVGSEIAPDLALDFMQLWGVCPYSKVLTKHRVFCSRLTETVPMRQRLLTCSQREAVYLLLSVQNPVWNTSWDSFLVGTFSHSFQVKLSFLARLYELQGNLSQVIGVSNLRPNGLRNEVEFLDRAPLSCLDCWTSKGDVHIKFSVQYWIIRTAGTWYSG